MSEELNLQKAYWDGTVEDFDSIYSHRKSALANWLDRVFRKDMFQRFAFTLDKCEPVAGRSFLDVGCGTGRYALELAKRNCRKVTGIDISEAMIRRCVQSADGLGVSSRTDFRKSDLLAFAEKTVYDVVIGIGLFDYISDALPVLAKMCEYSSDRSIISFPRLWTWRAPVRKLRLKMKKCDVFFYTKKEIEGLVSRAGFRKSNIEKVGKLFCVVAYK
jgi:2-polyprenyl-3-methyl-5-hydroxy-6-metoxy-1,4-benzoquinol methylase